MHIIIKKQRFSVTVIYCDLEMAWFSVHSSKVGCAGCWHLHLYKTAKIYYMSADVCVCVHACGSLHCKNEIVMYINFLTVSLCLFISVL